jgi:hypothetical protein
MISIGVIFFALSAGAAEKAKPTALFNTGWSITPPGGFVEVFSRMNTERQFVHVEPTPLNHQINGKPLRALETIFIRQIDDLGGECVTSAMNVGEGQKVLKHSAGSTHGAQNMRFTLQSMVAYTNTGPETGPATSENYAIQTDHNHCLVVEFQLDAGTGNDGESPGQWPDTYFPESMRSFGTKAFQQVTNTLAPKSASADSEPAASVEEATPSSPAAEPAPSEPPPTKKPEKTKLVPLPD